MKILVVEDDIHVAQALKMLLSGYNYAVDIAVDGEVGRQMADIFEYDLLILDVVLPKLDGVALCRELRDRKLDVPILLLTGQDSSHQKVIALNVGADDYVVKPFDTEELIARVHALLRRGNTAPPIAEWGELRLDPSCQKVTYGAQELTLTPKEYAILELFLRNGQKAFSAQQILDHAWDSLEAPGEETVRFHIKTLRKKLRESGASADFIKTSYGAGYGLNPLYDQAPKLALSGATTDAENSQTIAELTAFNQQLQTTLATLQAAQAKLKNQVKSRTVALREARDRLNQQEQQWQSLLDHCLDGVVITDEAGYPLEANRLACDWLGKALADLKRMPLADLLEPTTQFAEFWSQMLQIGRRTGQFEPVAVGSRCRTLVLTGVAHFMPQRHLVLLRRLDSA